MAIGNMKTRNQETHLYQDQDPVEKQIIVDQVWNERMDKKQSEDGNGTEKCCRRWRIYVEDEGISYQGDHYYQVPRKVSEIKTRSLWMDLMSQVIELREDNFQKANDDGEHDLNLYKSVIKNELEVITENKGNDGQNVKHGQ